MDAVCVKHELSPENGREIQSLRLWPKAGALDPNPPKAKLEELGPLAALPHREIKQVSNGELGGVSITIIPQIGTF